jgi:predicted phage-related endonuclease
MTLSAEQLAARDGKITAGFVPYLMAGKQDRILSEWTKLVGHQIYEEPDFSAMWNLHYGSLIEPIALDWHEKKTGQPLIRRGEVVTHPSLSHVCATLDSYRASDECVIDCKAWSSWQKIDYICSFLAPQIIVQKACTQAKAGALLIVHGGTEPVEYPLSWEADYEDLVWSRIDEFWTCVQELTPPYDLPAIDGPPPATKTYDMTKSNTWGGFAAQWLANRDAAKSFAEAVDELKALIPPDAKLVRGHKIAATRNKAGAISIREDAA